jgi:hypothetical protein
MARMASAVGAGRVTMSRWLPGSSITGHPRIAASAASAAYGSLSRMYPHPTLDHASGDRDPGLEVRQWDLRQVGGDNKALLDVRDQLLHHA